MPQDITKRDVNLGDVMFGWKIREYEKTPRDRRWYMIMGVITVLLLVYSIFTDNYLFSLIIVLFGIVLFMHEIQEPLELDIAVTETGVLVGKKFYRFSELDQYWIIYDPPYVKNLYLITKSVLKNRISIPLLDNDPRPVRDYLEQFLEENLDEEEEPLSDRLSRMFNL